MDLDPNEDHDGNDEDEPLIDRTAAMDLDPNEDHDGNDEDEPFIDRTASMDLDPNEDHDGNDEVGNEDEACNTSDNGEVGVAQPKQGMCFQSGQEFAIHCHKYGYQNGFQWHTRSNQLLDEFRGEYGKAKGLPEAQYYMMKRLRLGCVKAGKEKKYKQSQTSGCPVYVEARMIEGGFHITRLNLEHNHPLDPSNSRMLVNYKYMSEYHKRRIVMNDIAGVPVTKNYNSLVVESGGHEKLTFSQIDMRNAINIRRRLERRNGDASGLLEYFDRMCKDNPDFFCETEINEKGELARVLWSDARCRAMAKDFGDVVTFDTTHGTNRYDMFFAPFIGVNHHGSSVVLACGLILSQDANSFCWLFKSWQKCMRSSPVAILTDQCQAVGKAVKTVFPTARHRLCLFHIMQNASRNLGNHPDWKEIKKHMQVVVHESLEPAEFEEAWHAMVTEFGLGDYAWIKESYKERERWAPGFLRSSFWAGMSSTQRSEGLNHYFKGFLNTHTGLVSFAQQYHMALAGRVEVEKTLNAKSMDRPYSCTTSILVEEVFIEAYTNQKFKEVKEEVEGLMYTNASGKFVQGNKTTYTVDEKIVNPVWRSKKKTYLTTIDKVAMEIQCSCKLFEFAGILCRHIIKVIELEELTCIPEKYVLDRWRKNIVREYERVKVNYYDPGQTPRVQRFHAVALRNEYLLSLALHSEETYNTYSQALGKIEKQLEGMLGIKSCRMQENLAAVSKVYGRRRLQKREDNEKHTKRCAPEVVVDLKDPPDRRRLGRAKRKRSLHPAEKPKKKKKKVLPQTKKKKVAKAECVANIHATNSVPDSARGVWANKTSNTHMQPSQSTADARAAGTQVSASGGVRLGGVEWFKLSTCGLSLGEKGSGGGGVVTGPLGEVVSSYVYQTSNVHKDAAALNGILLGLRMVEEQKRAHVVLETNSAYACWLLNEKQTVPGANVDPLLDNCMRVIANTTMELKIQHVEELNSSMVQAVAVANASFSIGSAYSEWPALPPGIGPNQSSCMNSEGA